jgi:hypothetical protein
MIIAETNCAQSCETVVTCNNLSIDVRFLIKFIEANEIFLEHTVVTLEFNYATRDDDEPNNARNI